MKTKAFSNKAIVVFGVVFFTVGLLTILRENTVVSLLSQILPGAEAIEIFGVTIQLVGQILLVFGVVKSASNKFLVTIQTERQITVAGFTQSIQQLQAKMHDDRQALIASYNQTISKVDSMISNQKALMRQPRAPQPVACKFCGTRIDQGQFCPSCGKAN